MAEPDAAELSDTDERNTDNEDKAAPAGEADIEVKPDVAAYPALRRVDHPALVSVLVAVTLGAVIVFGATRFVGQPSSCDTAVGALRVHMGGNPPPELTDTEGWDKVGAFLDRVASQCDSEVAQAVELVEVQAWAAPILAPADAAGPGTVPVESETSDEAS